MAKFAVGNYAYGISDRSGFRYRLKDMRKEWNGSLVGKDEYESKHPQLEPKRRSTDAEALRDPRPDRTEPAIVRLLNLNCFKSGVSGSSIITVTEVSHGRSTGESVIFKKANGFDGFSKSTIELSTGYIITVIDTNTYTFTISGEVASLGNVRGGGGNVTVEEGASASTTASTFDSTSVTLDSTTKTFDEG
jgi:hypothetical protein|tara:strand:- start:542 stop:1114 length:573 start_codon:yes stop_codon:yes gene_type:complete